MHCGKFLPHPRSRREFLSCCAGGVGAIAVESLWAAEGRAKNQLSGLGQFHHAPRAKNIIFLYMDGGVSQVDSFDPKPRLTREHGKPFPARIEPTQFDSIGTTMACPWKFSQHGESGIWVSELFPHVATCADKLAVVRNMVSQFSEHNSANYFLHTGIGQAGLPSMGAWISYGLGSASANLPAFIVINGGLIPSGGMDNFSAGFLPALHQGTIFKPQELPISNLKPPTPIPDEQRALLRDLDILVAERFHHDDAVESTIGNYELAFRMQTTVPELADLSGESAYTHRLYGLDADYESTQIFGRECLLARRMIERGVRFIELTCPQTPGNDRWDAHSDLKKNHSENALATDQPIAGLLKDLDQRGLLEETLVVWSGEFGRTPFAQGSNGRDHNPFGFTIWLAGAGIAAGTVYGETDEFGYRAVGSETTIHDLHATMLHLLGVDHTRLTYRFGGRDMRLTDVHGKIVEPILA